MKLYSGWKLTAFIAIVWFACSLAWCVIGDIGKALLFLSGAAGWLGWAIEEKQALGGK